MGLRDDWADVLIRACVARNPQLAEMAERHGMPTLRMAVGEPVLPADPALDAALTLAVCGPDDHDA